MPDLKMRRSCAAVVSLAAAAWLAYVWLTRVGDLVLISQEGIRIFWIPAAFLVWGIYTLVSLMGAVQTEDPQSHQEQMWQAVMGRRRAEDRQKKKRR